MWRTFLIVYNDHVFTNPTVVEKDIEDDPARL